MGKVGRNSKNQQLVKPKGLIEGSLFNGTECTLMLMQLVQLAFTRIAGSSLGSSFNWMHNEVR